MRGRGLSFLLVSVFDIILNVLYLGESYRQTEVVKAEQSLDDS